MRDPKLPFQTLVQHLQPAVKQQLLAVTPCQQYPEASISITFPQTDDPAIHDQLAQYIQQHYTVKVWRYHQTLHVHRVTEL